MKKNYTKASRFALFIFTFFLLIMPPLARAGEDYNSVLSLNYIKHLLIARSKYAVVGICSIAALILLWVYKWRGESQPHDINKPTGSRSISSPSKASLPQTLYYTKGGLLENASVQPFVSMLFSEKGGFRYASCMRFENDLSWINNKKVLIAYIEKKKSYDAFMQCGTLWFDLQGNGELAVDQKFAQSFCTKQLLPFIYKLNDILLYKFENGSETIFNLKCNPSYIFGSNELVDRNTRSIFENQDIHMLVRFNDAEEKAFNDQHEYIGEKYNQEKTNFPAFINIGLAKYNTTAGNSVVDIIFDKRFNMDTYKNVTEWSCSTLKKLTHEDV